MIDLKKTFLLAAAGVMFGVSAENLLKGDTSFETEPHTLVSGNLDPGYMPVKWETKEVFHGKRALRVDWDKKNRRMVFHSASDGWVDNSFCMDTVDLKNGEYYTYSFYAKSKKPVRIRVQLDPNASWGFWPKGSVYGKSFNLTTEWKRYSFTFQAKIHPNGPYKGYNCWITLSRTPPGTIYFDAFQVNKGKKATAYVPSTAMSCGVNLKPFAHPEYRDTVKYIYYPGEKIEGDIRVLSNDGKGGELQIKVIDYNKKVLLDKKQAVKGGEIIPLKFDSKKRGWYKITATVTRGKKQIVRHQANYVVIDKPEKVAPGVEPFFGMICHLHFIDLMKRFGVNRIQISGSWRKTFRPGIENIPGKLDLREIEHRMKYAHSKGMKIKFSFSPFGAPKWYFDEALWNEVSKYPRATSSLTTEKTLARWKEISKTLAQRFGKYIHTYELGGEDNGVLGHSEYYRAKYPENVVNGWFCKGEIFNRHYDAVAEVANMIKKMHPHIKVGVFRPSQGIPGTDWTYIQKVFERIGKVGDVFPIDTYLLEPYSLSPQIKGHIGSIDGRVYTRDLCNSLIRKYGNNQKVFMSEASIEGDTLYPDESRWEIERAEILAKDFLISRAMGFFAFDSFSTVSSYTSARYNFSLTYRHHIQMSLASLAAAARIVENVVETDFQKLPGAARLCTYKKVDGSGRAAIWADRGYFFKPEKNANIQVFDMMGNLLKPDKEGKYQLATAPYTMYCKNYKTMMSILDKAEVAQSDFCEIRADVQKAGRLTIRLDNNSNKKDLRLDVAVKSDAGTFTRGISVAPGSYRLFTVPAKGRNAVVTVKSIESSGVVSKEFQIPEVIELKKTPVKFAFADQKIHMTPHEPWTPWGSPDDFSVDFYGSWDKNYLYVDVKVRDDKHFNKFTQTYQGDSVQIAIDPRSNAGINKRQAGLLGWDDIEFGIALSTKTGKKFSGATFGPKSLPGENNYTIVRDNKAGTTVYKMRIPWKTLGIKPTVGKVFGMALVVFDDDANSGQEYYAQVGAGIARRKNPEAFRKFSLGK